MSGSTLHHSDSDLEIHKVVVGPFENNVFVLRCRHTGEAVLLDAANEHERLLELARGLGVRRIPEMRDAGYSVGVTAGDAAMLPSYDELVEHDAVIEVGDLRLRTILTPGHTAGSMCFLVEGKPLLFSGDTLFPGGPGNTKLEGGDFTTIMTSIDDLLFTPLDTDTIVMPGHGSDTTIGAERPSFQEWVDRGW